MFKKSVEPPATSCEQRLAATLKLVNQYSHEINNQLTIIIGRTEQSVQAAKDDHLLQSYLGEISLAAQRVAEITRKMLAERAA